MGRERKRRREGEVRVEKKEEERKAERKKKEPERESVSAQSTHCLMFCSSATNKGSSSSPDITPAVIPTLFDVEPREERGTVMRVYKEKHLGINEYARR